MTSSATPVAERTNPVHRIAGAASDAFDRVTDSPAWAMTPAETRETLTELAKVQAQITELRWRVMAAAESHALGDADGSTSAAAWLARRTHESATRTHAMRRGALALDDPRFAPTRAAFAAGTLREEQVWVIIRAIEDLPGDEVTEEDRLLAQKHLIDDGKVRFNART